MAFAILSRFFGASRTRGARPVRRRPTSALPSFEVLEDRVTPSGGPGPSGGGGSGSSGGPSGGGGSTAPSGSTVLISTSGALVTGSSGKTYTLGSFVASLNEGGLTINQLFSGYPLPPGGGPALANDLVTLSDPSSVPYPMQNSNVALVPILLVSGSSSGSGSSSPSYTLVMLDPMSGTTYSFGVNMTPPAPSAPAGP
jgi:hypothetical protein